MSKTRMFFLRYGETHFNVFSRLQGCSNSQLTNEGIASTVAIGKKFKKFKFDFVCTSGLQSVVEITSLFLEENKHSDIKIIQDKRLREI